MRTKPRSRNFQPLGNCLSRLAPGWRSLALVVASLSSVPAATTTVGVAGFSFNPPIVSIQAGDTVIWTGLGLTHSVASDTPPETLCGSTPVPGGNCTNTFNTPGTYFYHCVNHLSFGMTGVVNVAAIALPPSVAVTNPAAGSVFAAPASIKLSANATSSGGSVTNVQFFSNGASLGSVSSPPFNLTTGPFGAGSFGLTAKATATTGLSATSAPVNIFVVTPAAVSNYAARVVDGQFVFEHTANAGLRYAVDRSSNLTSWSAVATNTAASNSVEVMDVFRAGSLLFYRVGRLSNP
jgi:plastocyanin